MIESIKEYAYKLYETRERKNRATEFAEKEFEELFSSKVGGLFDVQVEEMIKKAILKQNPEVGSITFDQLEEAIHQDAALHNVFNKFTDAFNADLTYVVKNYYEEALNHISDFVRDTFLTHFKGIEGLEVQYSEKNLVELRLSLSAEELEIMRQEIVTDIDAELGISYETDHSSSSSLQIHE